MLFLRACRSSRFCGLNFAISNALTQETKNSSLCWLARLNKVSAFNT
jgi:hypothetical protein